MAHDPLFDSPWFKWLGAIVHAQALKEDIANPADEADIDPVRAVGTQYDPKRHGFSVVVTELAPMSLRRCLLLGDIANNFRASLDHLAWALAWRGRTPPESGMLTDRQERAIAFPIYEDRLKYNRSLPRMLPGVRRADLAKVRRYQPYHYRPRPTGRHVLTLLYDINNTDKHRTIQPLWTATAWLDMEVADTRDCELSSPIRFRRVAAQLQVGAEIAFVRARKRGPNPELDVQAKVTAEPTVEGMIRFRAWQQRLGGLIFQLLGEFSDPPPAVEPLVASMRIV